LEELMMKDLVLKNRSYRRFHQDVSIAPETLRELVDLARLSASAINAQPLRYVLSSDPDKNASVFSAVGWAGYLKDWPGPADGERPSAYVVVLEDTGIAHPMRVDHGIAAQTIMLGATERGLGGCIIATIDKPRLREALDIPEQYEILLVLALGRPKETVVIDEIGVDGDIKYWRDAEGVHHVPKRRLDDVIIG
jgi:nitroreductase